MLHAYCTQLLSIAQRNKKNKKDNTMNICAAASYGRVQGYSRTCSNATRPMFLFVINSTSTSTADNDGHDLLRDRWQVGAILNSYVSERAPFFSPSSNIRGSFMLKYSKKPWRLMDDQAFGPRRGYIYIYILFSFFFFFSAPGYSLRRSLFSFYPPLPSPPSIAISLFLPAVFAAREAKLYGDSERLGRCLRQLRIYVAMSGVSRTLLAETLRSTPFRTEYVYLSRA